MPLFQIFFYFLLRNSCKFLFFFTFLYCFHNESLAQQEPTYQIIKKKRILFIMDASGSMNEKWKGEKKWDLAIQNLTNLLDSFLTENQEIQIGIRLLGHQFRKELNICTDTKLEMPFNNAYNKKTLGKYIGELSPKGHTPLALALSESEKDFTNSHLYENTIILITDGVENCFGNPCEVAQQLTSKKIVISPYIIGMGIDTSVFNKLECIGEFVDVTNKESFTKVIKSILTEVATKTSLEIYFQNEEKKPIYNVPYSLFDIRTGLDIYNFIKTQAPKSDPIQINSQYKYRMIIHTVPPIIIDTLPIIYGKNNILNYTLNATHFEYQSDDKQNTPSFYVKNNKNIPLYKTDATYPIFLNKDTQLKFIVPYTPIFYKNIDSINDQKNIIVPVLKTGEIQIKISDPLIEAVLLNSNFEWITDLKFKPFPYKIEIQTGNYFIVSKKKFQKSKDTHQLFFNLPENGLKSFELK